jgi:hypothetical protein
MRANAVGKNCSEVDTAYIAGFLDADGAIMAIIEPHAGKRYKFRVRVALKITQQDREVLDWIRTVLEVGIVRANRAGTSSQTFDLHIRDREHVQKILKQLEPFVRVKKRQAQIALEILDISINSSEDLVNTARLADTLSGLNVRSKNRRKNFVTKIQEQFSPND